MFICLDHGDGYNSPSSTSHCTNYEYEMFLELWEDCKLYLCMSPVIHSFTNNKFKFIGVQKWLFLE